MAHSDEKRRTFATGSHRWRNRWWRNSVLDKDGETLYIGRIFIDPILHRKGYGLSLMKLVEAYYPGIQKIKLDTPLWNVRTNAFYTKLGYYEVKRDGEIAYYQKELD